MVGRRDGGDEGGRFVRGERCVPIILRAVRWVERENATRLDREDAVHDVMVRLLSVRSIDGDPAAYAFAAARNYARTVVGRKRRPADELLDEETLGAARSAGFRTEEQIDELDAIVRERDGALVLRRCLIGDVLTDAERMRELRARRRLRGEALVDGRWRKREETKRGEERT